MNEKLDIELAIDKLQKAIIVKGKYPKFHDHVMQRHRSEWPALWQAIDEIIKIQKMNKKISDKA